MKAEAPLPLFSVLIANYNNGCFLEDTLKSIYNQTYQNWEVIIVDDGSTDNSREIYQKYAEDRRIRVFYNTKNEGCGYTKRKCVDFALGEICGFVDPDDAILPEAIEIMVGSHQDLPQCSIINSKFYYTDLELNVTRAGTFGERIPNGESYLTYGNYAITHFATFKRQCYLVTEGINAKLKVAVDQDLYYKLEETGSSFFINKYLYKYRANPNSISLNENAIKAIESHENILKDAYFRRKNKITLAKNLNKYGYKLKIYNFTKTKIIYATKNQNYKLKYILILKCYLMFPFKNILYLIRCLISPYYS